MPWQLSEFERERLEHARRLLTESEEHRGSTDLQESIQSTEAVVALHHLCLDDSGLERQGLTAGEQKQCLVLGLRLALCQMGSLVFVQRIEPDCLRMLSRATIALANEATEQSAQQAALRLLAELSTVWLWYAWTATRGPLGDAVACAQGYLQGLLASWEPWAAAAGQLERYQRQQGFSPSISAAELQEVFLLLKCVVCSLLVDWGTDQQALGPPALEAARLLNNLRPASPTYQFKLANGMANAGDKEAAARVLRTVFQAAQASNAHLSTYKAATWLFRLRHCGGEGQRVQLREQRRLLEVAERALELAKPCAPSKDWRQQQHTKMKQCWQILAALEYRWQGSEYFPAATFNYHSPATTAVIVHECATCTACGASAAKLKLCSACKSVFYCSTECQKAHWKAVHKQECKALAAARAAAGSSSSST